MGRDRKTYSEAGVSTSKEVERLKKKMKMKKQMRRRRITALIITLIIGCYNRWWNLYLLILIWIK